jgi:hypothetical protein
MSDWQPGDLALCVKQGLVACECGREYTGQLAPPVGSVAEVVGIMRCDDDVICGWSEPCAAPVLLLDSGKGGLAVRFRKIRPHTPDAEDAETIRLLTGKPVPEPAQ